ncbi:MAG: transcription initiation factor IIB [Candidatus Methanospirareceae archaeon]
MYKSSVGNREQLYKISKWQKRKRMSITMERNLSMARAEMDRIASILSIPDETKNHCMEIYLMALENNLARGRSMEGILAASVYIGCRKYNTPRTPDEIEKATKMDKNDIMKLCKLLASRLKISIAPASPLEYLDRFSLKLNLSKEVEEKAKEIIEGAIEENITSGKDPIGITAAAIYIAAILCGAKRTQKDIADATGVTEVTIRARCREITKRLKIEKGKG